MPALNAVTDPVLLSALARQQVNAPDVVFTQDYAHRGLGKLHSPYAKFYRNQAGPERFMVVSGLPMVTAEGDPIVPGWREAGVNFFAEKTNLMAARIQGRDVELVCRNAQPDGRAAGARLSYSPQLFVGGVEIPPAAPVLVPVDPWNPNYQENVLEWDYGVCKRKLRQVEGRVHGYWVFPANPGGDVRITYNQAGDYRLKLGEYAQNADEELIPGSVFAQATYPFEISDSATYYPDANPETTSVDGHVGRQVAEESWATLIAGAGTYANDTSTSIYCTYLTAGATSPLFTGLYRGILLFDTSPLPNNAVIASGVLSIWAATKADGLSATPNLNIYGSTPNSNTALEAADYGNTQNTAFSMAIAYANWASSYNAFTLNADGLAAISKTGVSKFSAKNANYDVAGTPPNWVSGATSYLIGYTSEQGASYKPKLVVTYKVPGREFFAIL